MKNVSLSAVVAVLWAGSACGQGFEWPEEPKNLQVFGASVKGRELGGQMRQFALGLGVRCQYCHLGKGGAEPDPQDLTSFDFALDSPAKEKARTMIRMVREINHTHLAGLPGRSKEASERIEVSCVTCHRGKSKPEVSEQ